MKKVDVCTLVVGVYIYTFNHTQRTRRMAHVCAGHARWSKQSSRSWSMAVVLLAVVLRAVVLLAVLLLVVLVHSINQLRAHCRESTRRTQLRVPRPSELARKFVSQPRVPLVTSASSAGRQHDLDEWVGPMVGHVDNNGYSVGDSVVQHACLLNNECSLWYILSGSTSGCHWLGYCCVLTAVHAEREPRQRTTSRMYVMYNVCRRLLYTFRCCMLPIHHDS
jgi:hypothetical protein